MLEEQELTKQEELKKVKNQEKQELAKRKELPAKFLRVRMLFCHPP